ncbi:uncharacterized protein [Anoplolepis gracilipes]|uniref:uncharacterized protein n=1 Tax=Anoplolepis gracilipes TaxID=354296 RepID=UPI003BA2FE26
MPGTCCVKNCKSVWTKNSNINFYRFPSQDETILKYWIAATGRNNWSPYTSARICSLHFTEDDYYKNKENPKRRRLKPKIIPTQYVHASILQVFSQDTNTLQISQDEIHKMKSYDQDSTIMLNEEKLIKDTNETTSNSFSNDQNSTITLNEEKLIENINNETISVETTSNLNYFKYSNYDTLLNENVQLKKELNELKKSHEKLLNQQASMFHELMNHKQATLAKKLKTTQDKNKTLNRRIQRKEKQLTNLKLLLKHLKDKNRNLFILKNIPIKECI